MNGKKKRRKKRCAFPKMRLWKVQQGRSFPLRPAFIPMGECLLFSPVLIFSIPSTKHLHSQLWCYHTWLLIFLAAFFEPKPPRMLFVNCHSKSVILSLTPTIAQPTTCILSPLPPGCPGKFRLINLLASLHHLHQHLWGFMFNRVSLFF